jgi:hypothetical protein
LYRLTKNSLVRLKSRWRGNPEDAAVLLPASEEELLALEPGCTYQTDYESVTLTDSEQPPAGFPEDPPTSVVLPENTRTVPPGKTETEPAEKPESKPKNLLEHPRDIAVSGGEHTTMFDCKIRRIGDLRDGGLVEQRSSTTPSSGFAFTKDSRKFRSVAWHSDLVVPKGLVRSVAEDNRLGLIGKSIDQF